MLSNRSLTEIRGHLENAKNPIFFFDNDVDGLTSFLLLQRFIGKGRGVAIKSFPGLNESYFKKVEEFNADYIFVLDKHLIDAEFVELAKEKSIPLVQIDHHDVKKPDIEFYYNTFLDSGETEATSYMCYKVINKKEEAWLALIGCIGDGFLPDFLGEFKKENEDLIDAQINSSFDVLYKTKLGKICQMLGYGLLDKTGNVV